MPDNGRVMSTLMRSTRDNFSSHALVNKARKKTRYTSANLITMPLTINQHQFWIQTMTI